MISDAVLWPGANGAPPVHEDVEAEITGDTTSVGVPKLSELEVEARGFGVAGGSVRESFP